MSDAIFMLRLEHGNLTRLLDVLEEQLRRLESGAPVDAELLRLTHEYLAGYPDECHHPKEDLLFDLLQRRSPAAAEALADLRAEHRELAVRTARLGEEIGATADGGIRPGAPLAHSLRDFLQFQREHMAREEREFFPVALSSLTRDDIAELDFHLFDRRDHLFDEASEARFEHLRSEIRAITTGRSEGGGNPVSRPSVDEISLVRNLSSVDQFNKAVAIRGLRLVVCRSGGYSLEKDGRWVMDIPDCDETRAAWSAYYFVKGRDGARGRG